MLSEEAVLSIVISVALSVASILFSLFLFDVVKEKLQIMYQAIVEETINKFYLPPGISQARILRFCYFIAAILIYSTLHKIHGLPFLLSVLAAITAPNIILFLVLTTLLIFWNILLFLRDVIYVSFYTPWRIYKEQKDANIYDFFSFYSYLMIMTFICGAFYALFFL